MNQQVHCRGCGRMIHETALACPFCGAQQGRMPGMASRKLILPAAILCFFFGCLGVHRFYVGKIGTGILQLLTLGGLGIWTLIDFILIVIGSFRDKEGLKLEQWV